MQITLVLTHQCNLACDYCYAGEKFARAMTYETGARALRMAFAAAGPGEAITVGFFGGEPMLEFPLMVRLTRLAHRLARRQRRILQLTVTSNGTVLSEKHLRFLYTYGFDTALSVDGLGQGNRHRPFATGHDSTAVVWGNIAAAAQMLEKLNVLMVVGPDSLDDLERSVQRLYQLGVPTVSLLPNVDVEWMENDWVRAREVFARLTEVCRRLLEVRPLVLHPLIDRLRPTMSASRCGFGDTEVAVSPRGHLYPCARLVGTDVRRDIRIGNVRDGIDLAQVAAVQTRSHRSMAGCGVDGPCGCVPLMPGTCIEHQLERYRRFGESIEQGVTA
ncbi:MAG TPA: radical SAM protein [Candidatus Xenobia bacterium]|jgi:uncharacterized protein